MTAEVAVREQHYVASRGRMANAADEQESAHYGFIVDARAQLTRSAR